MAILGKDSRLLADLTTLKGWKDVYFPDDFFTNGAYCAPGFKTEVRDFGDPAEVPDLEAEVSFRNRPWQTAADMLVTEALRDGYVNFERRLPAEEWGSWTVLSVRIDPGSDSDYPDITLSVDGVEVEDYVYYSPDDRCPLEDRRCGLQPIDDRYWFDEAAALEDVFNDIGAGHSDDCDEYDLQEGARGFVHGGRIEVPTEHFGNVRAPRDTDGWRGMEPGDPIGVSHCATVEPGTYVTGTVVEAEPYNKPGDVITMEAVVKSADAFRASQKALKDAWTPRPLAEKHVGRLGYQEDYKYFMAVDMSTAPRKKKLTSKKYRHHPNMKDGTVEDTFRTTNGVAHTAKVTVRDSGRVRGIFIDGQPTSDEEFEMLVGETWKDFYLDEGSPAEPKVPRKVTDVKEIMHLMPLHVYYDDTGEEVPDVFAYDLDEGYCWQHVRDAAGKFEMDGGKIRTRRVNGQFTVRRPK